YYVSYWFTVDGNATSYAESFMSVIGATSQIPNVGIMGSLMYRIVVPLIINCFLVIVIIALVIFVQPNDDDILPTSYGECGVRAKGGQCRATKYGTVLGMFLICKFTK
ncbi:hypothetical protein TELCIR_13269, partial [Teladorsagia circumcincta]